MPLEFTPRLQAFPPRTLPDLEILQIAAGFRKLTVVKTSSASCLLMEACAAICALRFHAPFSTLPARRGARSDAYLLRALLVIAAGSSNGPDVPRV
jgi:hypothetical protein